VKPQQACGIHCLRIAPTSADSVPSSACASCRAAALVNAFLALWLDRLDPTDASEAT
jgi:hypothetical protein